MEPNHHHQNKPPASSPAPPSRWWTEETIAVVTGANKGIGYALVKKLAQAGVTVVLTCRDRERGSKAAESLTEEGIPVHFHCLDISDASSVESFTLWFRQTFGALDILVNNAGVSFKEVDGNSVNNAETVINTNYYGTKRISQALLPCLRRSSTVGRILNISSRLGHINKVKNPSIVAMLQGENLSEGQVDAMVGSFLADVKDGTWENKGWPEIWTDYAVSKLALNAYSRILAKRNVGCGLSVNCFCPGFTKTSMTGGIGKRTADEAAATGAMLALLPPSDLPTGKFFMGCGPVVNSRL